MLKEIEVRREAISQYRALEAADSRAVRDARTRLPVNREPCAVLTEPVGGVIEDTGEAMLNVVVGGRQHFFFWVVKRSVHIVRKRDRRGHRVHVLRVCPGVAQTDVPAVVIRFE